jgi:hypothetical protein
VGPARSYEAYEDKAATTAEAALSAVSTTILAAQVGAEGNAWGTYLSVLISEQEDKLAGVQGTFAAHRTGSAQARVNRELDPPA